MSFRSYILIKILLLLGTLMSCSAVMTRLFNTRGSVGTITSSTLAWIGSDAGQEVPFNAVPIGDGGPAWCRSFQNGIWVSGAVLEGRCHAPFFSSVEVTDKFQILVSVNGSARLLSVPWDSLTKFPLNPVSTPNMLLAVSNDAEGGAVLPGFVDPKNRRAFFLQGDKSLKLTGGFLITEDEPIAYSLSDVRLSSKTKRTHHDEVLQEFTLENPTQYSEEVSREVTFISPHQTYFGRVKGTIIGLPATVRGPDTIPVNITWGTNNQLDQERSHVVKYDLPGGTKVNVQLIAVIRVIDGRYGGRLESFYRDGERIKRHIGGLHTERRLAKLRAEFSQVRRLKDDTPVEDLPPQSKVLLHSSTTTTPSPTEQIADASENLILPRPQPVSVATSGRSSFLTMWSMILVCLFLLK